jgi:Zn-finger protein
MKILFSRQAAKPPSRQGYFYLFCPNLFCIKFKGGSFMGQSKDVKEIFDSTLFWDAREIDMDRHAEYVISRVLDFGDETDLKKLRQIYSDTQLIAVVQQRRGLLPMTRRFWSVYFGIPDEEKKKDV